jgi:hypothetical protein
VLVEGRGIDVSVVRIAVSSVGKAAAASGLGAVGVAVLDAVEEWGRHDAV